MRGSVIWAMLTGLLLGGVIGAAGMGAVLLPVQFNLQEEKLKLKEAGQYQIEQHIDSLQELENTQALQRKTEMQRQQLVKEKEQLKRQLDDAMRKVAELEMKSQKKKP